MPKKRLNARARAIVNIMIASFSCAINASIPDYSNKVVAGIVGTEDLPFSAGARCTAITNSCQSLSYHD